MGIKNYLPTAGQSLALCFLSLLGYVQAFGEGTPCTTYQHLWLGKTVTYAAILLSVWLVTGMVLDWIAGVVASVGRREHPGNQG